MCGSGRFVTCGWGGGGRVGCRFPFLFASLPPPPLPVHLQLSFILVPLGGSALIFPSPSPWSIIIFRVFMLKRGKSFKYTHPLLPKRSISDYVLGVVKSLIPFSPTPPPPPPPSLPPQGKKGEASSFSGEVYRCIGLHSSNVLV